MSDHRALLGPIAATLREAGFPLADEAGRGGGAKVACQAHGVTVSWQSGAGDAAAEPPRNGIAGSAHARGAAAVRSRHFQFALRVAALLADSGYLSEHLGDRVLVSYSDAR
ncbi:hypothetical protein ACGF12_37860 [Kitasatospora sp. NPDC048296]|uniref:hypothetical protein n=1 Tax=Kitasatospora sp. NPDC048296 TaxID=3364048 RepID=UPI00371B8B21